MADAAPSHVHLPDLGAGTDSVTIEGEEAHYLARVVRVRAGDRVSATDGRGLRAELEVLALRPSMTARVLARERRERPRTLELWCGAPEGERADWLVEKLGELAVATLRLLETERGGWDHVARRRPRWERLAVAALRQSQSTHLLRIEGPEPLAAAAGRIGATGPGRWLADASGAPARAMGTPGEGASVIAVGPSSGFSAAEVKWMQDLEFVPIRLAGSRLRTETAALAAACWWAGA